MSNWRAGRLQRTLAAATGLSALAMGVEVYFEHYRGSFANKWMWAPIVAAPPLAVAGAAAVGTERAVKPLLLPLSTLYAAQGVWGGFLHVRGVRRRPGGFHEPIYNIVMGPPLLAPGSLTAIGLLGMAAPLFKREQ